MLTSVQTRKPKKNKFDLSREAKLTGNMGYLYPCFIQDVVPGDSFKVNTSQLVRFSPMLSPAMHQIDFKIDYFFVPYRLVWDEWKDFITGGEDGEEYPSYPRFEVNTDVAENYLFKGSLADYMGIPPYIENSGNAWEYILEDSQIIGDVEQHQLSLLPFRAYQLIYHEYFRDQNVGTEFNQYTGSGILLSNDPTSSRNDQLNLRKSNWQKDYFTSALPFLQRGEEVTLPLGNIAPLEYVAGTTADKTKVKYQGSHLQAPQGDLYTDYNSGETNVSIYNYQGGFNFDVSENHVVDLTQATGATINALRKASALQQWLELMARAGSRYREQIYAIFGERIQDYTVQVPQYLGGGKTPIQVNEILNTYENTSNANDRPVGDMHGHGIGVGSGLGFKQSFDEHGVILGLCRIIPKASYVQGLSKFWQKFDKFQHYFPQFANLGEQPVSNSELYVTGTQAMDNADSYPNAVFGYQQRYAEYKYSFDTMAGDFYDSLAYWELSRRFTNTPVLNQSFIECNPSSRIFALHDDSLSIEEQEDKIWINLYHKTEALRPMPYHSNPMLT